MKKKSHKVKRNKREQKKFQGPSSESEIIHKTQGFDKYWHNYAGSNKVDEHLKFF